MPRAPTFAGLAEAAGLHRATDDIPKTWEKVDRLEGLLAFDVGAFVWMEGKGAGRVVEVNFGLESFKVDLESQRGLNVGFRAAGKLLKPLPPGHLQRRKLEDPGELARLRDAAPAELLRAVLESGEPAAHRGRDPPGPDRRRRRRAMDRPSGARRASTRRW